MVIYSAGFQYHVLRNLPISELMLLHDEIKVDYDRRKAEADKITNGYR